LDGSKVDILGDASRGTGQIKKITTPDGHIIDVQNNAQRTMVENFKDETGTSWQWQNQVFVDAQNRQRRDVVPVPGGAVAVRRGNVLTTYETNGTYETYVTPPTPQR
jgi:hypothetical protein